MTAMLGNRSRKLHRSLSGLSHVLWALDEERILERKEGCRCQNLVVIVTVEFKQQAVQLVMKEGLSVAEAARRLDVISR